MKSINTVKLTIQSLPENIALARVFVAAFIAQVDLTVDELEDIKVAVSEAVSNAIIHGYENPNEMVQIITRIYDTYVEIEVIDHGKGIEDIELARQPLYTSKPELERSGMGFTVMETFMDQVEVISAPGQGTKVRMIKYIGNEERETERE